MKLKLSLFLVFLTTAMALFAVPEKYISVKIDNPEDMSQLTKEFSIDNRVNNTLYGYALPQELKRIKELGYFITELDLPKSDRDVLNMATSLSEMSSWDKYPTYDVYVEMMQQFASDYPNICSLHNIGTSQDNHDLLVLKISDNVSVDEAEPAFYYTGQMHGDELLTYILLLRLADELLSSYDSDTYITSLINNMEIWINPLSNPDGTYYGSDDTVVNSRRYLANNVDPNRNFIDFLSNTTGDGNPVSIENQAQIDFMTGKGIVMSANLHNGEEVINYPWDTTPSLHPDDTWYQYVSRIYADEVHADAPSTYLDGYDDGITNGYAWYEANGSRQDYVNYFMGIREVTIELSMTKQVPSVDLPAYWTYNRDALLAYMEQAMYGLQGNVTDYVGNPLEATIELVGHDTDVTKVSTNPDFGDYYRPINAGTYQVKVSTEGYENQIFDNVVVANDAVTSLDVVFGSEANSLTLDLNDGWNLISYNIDYDNTEPANVFADFNSDILELKNLTQIYSPDNPSHFNTLNQLSPAQGYWLNINGSQSHELSGDLYDVSTSIPLTSGWNLVGYLPNEDQAPETALNSISEYLVQVKDETSIYSPQNIPEFNSMNSMQAGKGYWMQVSEDCNLVYSTGQRVCQTRDGIPWDITIYPNNSAVINAQLFTNSLELNPGEHYIGAFYNDQCLGAARVVDINHEGDFYTAISMVCQVPLSLVEVQFKLLPQGYTEEILLQHLVIEPGQTYGSFPEDLVHLNVPLTSNDSPEQVSEIQIDSYPNPFKENLTVEIKARNTQMSQVVLYNLRGQKVYSKEISLNNKSNKVNLNLPKLSSGIYFLKVEGESNSSLSKVVKID